MLTWLVPDITTLAGAGVQGTAHTERGLTYLAVGASGHFLTQDAPAVAFRSMEVLLGRVDGFQSMTPFTIDTNNTPQPGSGLGNGTVLILNGAGVVDSGVLNMLEGGGGGVAAVEAVVNQAERGRGKNVSFVGLVVLFGLLMVW